MKKAPGGAPPGLHPRDRFITVFGRKPVLEALEDTRVPVEKVVVAHGTRGDMVDAILAAAAARKVPVQHTSAQAVTRISRNGRQDQGVVADVTAPRMRPMADALAAMGKRATVLLLDGLTTPANVGMLLRAATAAGVDGIVLPRLGSPEVGPLVIKASAGVAFHAPILRAETAVDAARALKDAGFTLFALRGQNANDLYAEQLPARTALVLGNEALGVSPGVAALCATWLRIPMAGGVESLNVAVAGAVVVFELFRRRHAGG